MALKTWPYRLLTPRAQQSLLVGSTITGGRSLGGFSQTARMDGGGFWRTTFSDINLHGRERILAARALSAYLQGGAQAINIPLWDLGFAPRPWVGGEPALGGLPEPSAEFDPWGWGAGFGEPIMVGRFDNAAALRATEVSLTISRGSPPVAGQHFGVNHTTWGNRAYRIVEIKGRDVDDYLMTVTPPMREYVGEDVAIELDVPLCAMTLSPESAEALEPVIMGGRLAGPVSATFIEAKGPI